MSDDLFTLKREAAAEPFEFTVEGHDGKIRIPHLAEVDQFDLAELLAESPTDLTFITRFMRWAMSGEDFAALQDAGLSRPMVDALWKGYQTHCGLKPGESKDSSG